MYASNNLSVNKASVIKGFAKVIIPSLIEEASISSTVDAGVFGSSNTSRLALITSNTGASGLVKDKSTY